MRILLQVGVVFLHWTWGILQTFVGFLVFLCTLNRPHYWKDGAVITEIKGKWGGVTIGMFVFVDGGITDDNPAENFTIKHEYGHTLQSILLGPLWIFIIAIPSLIWAGFCSEYRLKHKMSYYDFYTEAWANKWGGVDG